MWDKSEIDWLYNSELLDKSRIAAQGAVSYTDPPPRARAKGATCPVCKALYLGAECPHCGIGVTRP